MEAPVHYVQSVIAIELVVAGALLFQIRYFDKPDETAHPSTPRRERPEVGRLPASVKTRFTTVGATE